MLEPADGHHEATHRVAHGEPERPGHEAGQQQGQRQRQRQGKSHEPLEGKEEDHPTDHRADHPLAAQLQGVAVGATHHTEAGQGRVIAEGQSADLGQTLQQTHHKSEPQGNAMGLWGCHPFRMELPSVVSEALWCCSVALS